MAGVLIFTALADPGDHQSWPRSLSDHAAACRPPRWIVRHARMPAWRATCRRQAPMWGPMNNVETTGRRVATRNAPALIVSLAICFAAAGVGSIAVSQTLGTWYTELRKPGWNPPNWIFGPVWSSLYTAMAIAAWLVWKNRTRSPDAARYRAGLVWIPARAQHALVLRLLRLAPAGLGISRGPRPLDRHRDHHTDKLASESSRRDPSGSLPSLGHLRQYIERRDLVAQFVTEARSARHGEGNGNALSSAAR